MLHLVASVQSYSALLTSFIKQQMAMTSFIKYQVFLNTKLVWVPNEIYFFRVILTSIVATRNNTILNIVNCWEMLGEIYLNNLSRYFKVISFIIVPEEENYMLQFTIFNKYNLYKYTDKGMCSNVALTTYYIIVCILQTPRWIINKKVS